MNAISKTANRLFNAMAFANVSNLGEFHTLLRQIDEPDHAVREPAQPRTTAQSSDCAPLMGYAKGAV